MIEVTKRDKERTKYILNENKIIKIESGPGNQAVISMDNGEVFTVLETKEDIIKKVREESVYLLTKAFEKSVRIQLGDGNS